MAPENGQQPGYQPQPPVAPQPPVFNAPVPPTAPQSQPMGAAPVGYAPQQPMMPQKSGSGAKIAIIIGAIVGGLILIGVAIFVVMMLMGVSKKDYQAALSAYNDVSSANTSVNSELSTLTSDLNYGTISSVSNDVSSVKTSLDKLKSTNQTLGKLKAVNVGKGKELYGNFNKKIEAYTAYVSDFTTSVDKASSAVQSCDSTSGLSSTAAINQALNDCLSSLKSIGTLPDQDLNAYITTLTATYQTILDAMNQISAITDPYGSQYSQYKALRDKVTTASTNLTNAMKDYESNQKKHEDEVSPKAEADALSNYLYEQSK